MYGGLTRSGRLELYSSARIVAPGGWRWRSTENGGGNYSEVKRSKMALNRKNVFLFRAFEDVFRAGSDAQAAVLLTEYSHILSKVQITDGYYIIPRPSASGFRVILFQVLCQTVCLAWVWSTYVG